MTKILPAAVILVSGSAFRQDSLKGVVSVFCFGGSDCPYCVDQNNVEHINEMRAQMPKTYPESTLKFVLVVMDKKLSAVCVRCSSEPSGEHLLLYAKYSPTRGWYHGEGPS